VLGVLLLHCQSWGENCRKKDHHSTIGEMDVRGEEDEERIKEKDECDVRTQVRKSKNLGETPPNRITPCHRIERGNQIKSI
jgi:hypothetical protein